MYRAGLRVTKAGLVVVGVRGRVRGEIRASERRKAREAMHTTYCRLARYVTTASFPIRLIRVQTYCHRIA